MIIIQFAAEVHSSLIDTYADNTLLHTTCRHWFRRFKNEDFHLENKERNSASTYFQKQNLSFDQIKRHRLYFSFSSGEYNGISVYEFQIVEK